MEVVQFTAVVILTLLTLELVLMLPPRVVKDKVLNRSRCLMAISTALLALQFLLQYINGYRTMGITQAVMVNLLFFVPCSAILSLAMLNLQQGYLERKVWILALASTLIIWTLLGIASAIDDQPLAAGSIPLQQAEYASSIIYAIMMCYFCFKQLRNDRRLKRTLENYYGESTRRLLQWMRCVMIVMILLGLVAPFLIFSSGLLLKIYSACILLTIFYMITSFTFYCVSNDACQVMEAEQTEKETNKEEEEKAPSLSYDERQKVARTVELWVTGGGYLHSGLTISKAADEMRLPRYQLSMWLKTTEWELFNPWLTYLRIEEAKRLLLVHQDWSNDAVASQSGFSSRNYFQQVFKRATGMTPAQFVEKNVSVS